MWVLGVMFGLIVMIYSWKQLRNYARIDSPIIYLFIVWLSWTLGASALIVLLPTDMAISDGDSVSNCRVL